MQATTTTTMTFPPTTTGQTERKPLRSKPKLNWFEASMTLGDLAGTAGDKRFDGLAERLADRQS